MRYAGEQNPPASQQAQWRAREFTRILSGTSVEFFFGHVAANSESDSIATWAPRTLEWMDWFNTRRFLKPIGNRPSAEAEAAHYRQIEHTAVPA